MPVNSKAQQYDVGETKGLSRSLGRGGTPDDGVPGLTGALGRTKRQASEKTDPTMGGLGGSLGRKKKS